MMMMMMHIHTNYKDTSNDEVIKQYKELAKNVKLLQCLANYKFDKNIRSP